MEDEPVRREIERLNPCMSLLLDRPVVQNGTIANENIAHEGCALPLTIGQ